MGNQVNMNDTSHLLTGVCPGSDKDIGVQYKGQQVLCQTCKLSVQVNVRGTIRRHPTSFRYLAFSGEPGELEAWGLQYRGSGSGSHCYFEFTVSGWRTERPAARMALPLCEIKRFHEFLGAVISAMEQKCASSPRFYAQVKGADDYIKHPLSGPDIRY